ncbi:MAG: hypothetical protein WC829_17645 [Hyphomicrobium sp.]|jgi:hypothetical protein
MTGKRILFVLALFGAQGAVAADKQPQLETPGLRQRAEDLARAASQQFSDILGGGTRPQPGAAPAGTGSRGTSETHPDGTLAPVWGWIARSSKSYDGVLIAQLKSDDSWTTIVQRNGEPAPSPMKSAAPGTAPELRGWSGLMEMVRHWLARANSAYRTQIVTPLRTPDAMAPSPVEIARESGAPAAASPPPPAAVVVPGGAGVAQPSGEEIKREAESADRQRRAAEAAEATRAAEEAQSKQRAEAQAADIQRRADEEKRMAAVAEARRKAQIEARARLIAEAEARRQAEAEAQRLAAETKRQADEADAAERRAVAEAEAQAKRQAEIDAEATRRSEAAARAKEAARAVVAGVAGASSAGPTVPEVPTAKPAAAAPAAGVQVAAGQEGAGGTANGEHSAVAIAPDAPEKKPIAPGDAAKATPKTRDDADVADAARPADAKSKKYLKRGASKPRRGKKHAFAKSAKRHHAHGHRHGKRHGVKVRRKRIWASAPAFGAHRCFCRCARVLVEPRRSTRHWGRVTHRHRRHYID